MVAGFTTTYAIDVYHHKSCEYGSRSWRCVFNTTLCDKVYQWVAMIGGFHQYKWQPRYNWNIVKSCAKHSAVLPHGHAGQLQGGPWA